VDKELVEIRLSHRDEDNVRAAYNFVDRLPKRKVIMQNWADWPKTSDTKKKRKETRDSSYNKKKEALTLVPYFLPFDSPGDIEQYQPSYDDGGG
jgi:hypothetical protein